MIPIVGVRSAVSRGSTWRAALQDGGRAWTSTRAALVAIGIGMLIELTAGVLMIGVWLLGLWLT